MCFFVILPFFEREMSHFPIGSDGCRVAHFLGGRRKCDTSVEFEVVAVVSTGMGDLDLDQPSGRKGQNRFR